MSKRAVGEIPPLALLPTQLTVSVAALAIVTFLRGGGVAWSPDLHRMGLVGILNPGIAYVLSLMGLALITASMSVLLWAVEPLLISMLAVAVLRERVTVRHALATILAVAGVAALVFDGGSGAALGVALTLAGVCACAVYTVISRRLLGTEPALSVVLVQQLYALVFAVGMVGVAAVVGLLPAVRSVSATAWISAAISGLIYYAVAFWCYLNGLRGLPASAAAVFLNLVPVFGVAAGYVLLAERLSGRQWIGAAAVVVVVTTAALLRIGQPSAPPTRCG